MSANKTSRTLSLAMGTAFAAGMAASNVAAAAQSSNPFAMSELSSGYMQLADNHVNDKAGEGRCGEGRGNSTSAEKSKKKAEQEGQCGEGKKPKKEVQEGKCGEGKCGSSMGM